MSHDSRVSIDYTNKDYQALREAMLALAKEKLPEWTDHSPNDLGVVLLELFAYMGDVLLYYQDRIADESYLHTAVERRSIVNLLRLIGYELRPPTPASADLSLLFQEDATGFVTINPGAEFQTTAKATGEPVSFQYVREKLTINLDAPDVVEQFTHTDGNSYNKLISTLPVVQVDAAIKNEIIGSSDSTAGQRFRLARAPLIEEYLEICVDEGGTEQQLWQRRETLLHSLSTERHYFVQREEGDVAVIEFGDGRHGMIPSRGRNNITATYRVGGGIRGNVPANTIVSIVTPISDQLKAVFNAEPATGGADAESSEEAVQRGPQMFRAQERAVTAKDYEAHAKAFGVGKARARAAGWNRVELFVAPVGGGQPTDTLKEDLRNYFEDRRIMTTLLDVKDPTYVNVSVGGILVINAYHFTEQVQQRVSNAVAELMSFDNVDFEQTIYLSKFYEAIEAIDGVDWVEVTRLGKSDPATDADLLPVRGQLVFGWDEIPCGQPLVWRQDPSDRRNWQWQTWRFDETC